MKAIKILLVIAFLGYLAQLHAQTFREVKSWRFKLPHGSLEVNLRTYSDGWATLGISPYDQVPEAPIEEQTVPLRQVLSEMPSSGIDPSKLGAIYTHLWGRDVRDKLAYACADSTEWHQIMKAGGKGKEKLVVAFLNRSGAYDPYNTVFKELGIHMRVSEAEMVGLMKFSKIPARDKDDRAKARLLVPADAMLTMRFSRIDHDDAKE